VLYRAIAEHVDATALGAFLETCLHKSFGISLETQAEWNRELARVGSETGAFGTMDQISASDSIWWSLVQRIMPNNILGYMRLFRCERTVLPSGVEMDLKMVSTMGNGFTFPLQTLIFACAVRSVYQLMGLQSACPKTQFGVFGDDIIVRTCAYNFLAKMLSKLGFQVNDSKSFSTGSFRESCGHDWYAGHFVRGVYIRSLETTQDVYSAINRLNRWSAMAEVRLNNTISFLLRFAERKHRVPFSEAIDCGIQVPFELTRPKLDDNYWFTYRKVVRQKRQRQVPRTLEESRALGYAHYNEYGWGVTYLGGFARSEERPLIDGGGAFATLPFNIPRAFLTLRDVDGSTRIKVVRCTIPYWDWHGPKGLMSFDWSKPFNYDPYLSDPFRFFSYGSWRRTVASNFGISPS